jgi:hypothetical protein
LPLQLHPNKPDETNSSNEYIELVDADRTLLHFVGNAAGTVYKEPPRVHLHLLDNRSCAEVGLNRPDGVTFGFYAHRTQVLSLKSSNKLDGILDLSGRICQHRYIGIPVRNVGQIGDRRNG